MRALMVMGLTGCGAGSPYTWDTFGFGDVTADGCTGFVGFTADDAPQSLDVVCVEADCVCLADEEEVADFVDDQLCDDWERAMNGSAKRQDRMIGRAVASCGL